MPNALTGKEVVDWTEARETAVVMSLLQQCPPSGQVSIPLASFPRCFIELLEEKHTFLAVLLEKAGW